jgi:hypothetical protein
LRNKRPTTESTAFLQIERSIVGFLHCRLMNRVACCRRTPTEQSNSVSSHGFPKQLFLRSCPYTPFALCPTNSPLRRITPSERLPQTWNPKGASKICWILPLLSCRWRDNILLRPVWNDQQVCVWNDQQVSCWRKP